METERTFDELANAIARRSEPLSEQALGVERRQLKSPTQGHGEAGIMTQLSRQDADLGLQTR
jgi:hypothetical protein